MNIGQYFLEKAVIASLLVLWGCNVQRDLGHDPVNSPVIAPQRVAYNAQRGVVEIDWEYLSVEPVVRFRIVRKDSRGVYLSNWLAPKLSREKSERADVWVMERVADTALNAGVRYDYFLRTENAFGHLVEALCGDVEVPGAWLENIDLHPAQGMATATWRFQHGIPRYVELIRQAADDPAQVVFRSGDLPATQFDDRLPEGNREYTYVLRSFFEGDVALGSHRLLIRPYMRQPGFQVREAPDTHIMLSPAASLNSPVAMLSASSQSVSIRHLNVSGDVREPYALPVPHRERLRLASLSFAVTPVGRPPAPHIVVAGILPLEQRAQLLSFRWFGNAFEAVPWAHSAWPVDDPGAATATAVSPDGSILVAIGQTLRVFAFEGDAIAEIGTVALLDGVRHMAAFESGVWIITQSGRILRSPPVRGGGGVTMPVWQEVPLPVDTQPVWINGYDRGVFVLDQAHNRILAFDFDGSAGLWWQGMDDLDFHSGGLAVSRAGDVYVWDAQNRLSLFLNLPALVERYPDPVD